MDKNDFLNMYPIWKRLFFAYADYIKYSIDNLVDMDEVDHLPGIIEEIKSWFRILNTWFPAKINGGWVNCTRSV